MFGINGIGMVAAVKAASVLIMKYDERTQLKTALAISLTGSCLLLLAALAGVLNLTLLLILLFIIASCVGVGECNSFSLAMQHIHDNAGSAAGLLGIGSFLLGAAVSPLAGINGPSVYTLAAILIITDTLSLLALKFIPHPHG